MKILIAGSGDTGVHLARTLSAQNHDVVLMGTNKDVLDALDSSYNIMTMVADATSPVALRNAAVNQAHMVVAVTPSQAVNLMCCQLSHKLGAQKCIARVDDAALLDLDLGNLVFPELLAARELDEFVRNNKSVSRFNIGRDLVLCSMKIRPGAPADGRQLKDLGLGSRHFHVVLVRRDGNIFIPHGDDVLQNGDLAFFFTYPSHEQQVADLCGHSTVQCRNIMIAGAGKITRQLVPMLADMSVTVIDADAALCNRIAALEMRGLTVVNADPRELSSLTEEQLPDMDMFMALTDDDATNIVTSMMARRAGCALTAAHISSTRFISGIDSLQIDKIINKKLITSGHILRMVLGSDLSIGMFHSLEDADIAEIQVEKGAKVCSAPVRRLSLPTGMTFGALSRDGNGMLVDGDTQLQPGDRVVVVFTRGSILKVRHWFK